MLKILTDPLNEGKEERMNEQDKIREIIESLAEKTDISQVKFLLALAVSPFECPATTIDEAKEAYNNALFDSEAEAAALTKWIGFCTTIDEAKEAYNYAPDDSKAEAAVLCKMVEIASQK